MKTEEGRGDWEGIIPFYNSKKEGGRGMVKGGRDKTWNKSRVSELKTSVPETSQVDQVISTKKISSTDETYSCPVLSKHDEFQADNETGGELL